MSDKSLSKGASGAAPQIRKCGKCGGRLAPVRSSATSAQFRCQDCGAKFAFKRTPIETDSRDAQEKKQERDQRLRRFWENTLQGSENPGMSIRPDASVAVGGSTSAAPTAAGLPQVNVVAGDVVAGPDAPLQILNKLNEGGMGVIFRARQQSLHREIALKQMRGGALAQSPENVAQFLSEAYATGLLDHPNIVPVHELGRDQKGAVFYTMKLVQGRPWKDYLYGKTEDPQTGPHSMQDHLEVLLKVCDAIAFAHSRAIIHRDLKPENVMVGAFGEVLVVDWGLAATVQRTGADRALLPYAKAISAPGGTPHYMPPEMALGIGDQIGAASDVYLLGAILFEVLFRRTPHQGDSVWMVLSAAANNEIQFPEVMGPEIRAYYQVFSKTLNRALATQPESRYGNATAFAADLREDLKHYESVRMAATANDTLRELTARSSNTPGRAAEGTGKSAYFQYAEVIAGLKQALAAWPENRLAQEWLQEAHVQYAQAALAAGDLGLAQAQLVEAKRIRAELSIESASTVVATADVLSHQITDAVQAQMLQATKAKRLKGIQLAATVALVALVLVITVALFMVNSARSTAEVARQDAESQKVEALHQAAEANRQKQIAETARVEAETQRTEAQKQEAEATRQRVLVEQQKAVVEQQRALAEESQQRAVTAQRETQAALERTKSELYAGNIRMASKYLAEKNFPMVDSLLESCDPAMRQWEWYWIYSQAHPEEMRISSKGVYFEITPDFRLCITYKDTYYQIISIPDRKVLAAGNAKEEIADVEIGEKTLIFTRWAVPGKVQPPPTCLSLESGEPLSPDAIEKRYKSIDSETRFKNARNLTIAVKTTHPDEPDKNYQYSIELSEPSSPKPACHIKWEASDAGSIRTWAISPDGKKLCVGLFDGTIKVWNIGNLNEPKLLFTQSAYSRIVWGVAFAADNKTLITTGYDGFVKFWDTETPIKLQWKVPVPGGMMTGEGKALSNRQVCLINSQLLLIGGTRGFLRAGIDPSVSGIPGVLWASAKSRPSCISRFDLVGQLCYFSSDQELWVYDFRTCDSRLVQLPMSSHAITCITHSRDAEWIAIGREDGQIELIGPNGHQTLIGHHRKIQTLEFSADQTKLISGSYGEFPNLLVWEVKSGKQLQRMDFHGWDAEIGVSACRFSPDGKVLATTGNDGVIRLWDVEHLDKPTGVLIGHSLNVNDCAFNAEGTRLFSVGDDKKLKVWDIRHYRELLTIDTDGKGIECLYAENNAVVTYERGGGLVVRKPKLYPDAESESTALTTKAGNAPASSPIAAPLTLQNNVELTFEALRSALINPDEIARTAAVQCINPNSPLELELLRTAAKDRSALVRRTAVLRLREAGPIVIDDLVRAIGDSDSKVRAASVASLAYLGTNQVIPSLQQALEDQNMDVKLAAILALSHFDDPQALESLTVLASDTDLTVRKTVADVLTKPWGAKAEYVNPRYDLLKKLLKDTDPDVRISAVRQLTWWEYQSILLTAAKTETVPRVLQQIIRGIMETSATEGRGQNALKSIGITTPVK